jgi:hypothetical protein
VKPLNQVRLRVPVLIFCLFPVLGGLGAFAQDAPALPAGSPTSVADEPIAPIAPANAQPVSPRPGTIDKRLFGVIPNYRADQIQAVYTPISTREKFAIARSDSFDWPNYFLLAGYALQSQIASGGFKHSGGMEGFGEFYARAMADQVIGSYVTEAVLPSLLHEDPRFFRLGIGSVWHRAYYATTRVFVVRLDDGGTRFNISEIVGNMGVTAVSSFYYPNSQSAGEAAERYGMALGNDAISNLLTEFWPDVKRRLPFLHRKA